MIGGGDTGTDCVGPPVRHGFSSLVHSKIYHDRRRARQGKSRARMAEGLSAGIRPGGGRRKVRREPRIYLTTATRFEGDAGGHVKAVHTVQMKWERNEEGEFIPNPCPEPKRLSRATGTPGDGLLGPEQPLLEPLKLERDPRTNVKAEFEKYSTNLKGVFASGDSRRGQSLVVWAFNEGRGAARECDRYLMGRTDLP